MSSSPSPAFHTIWHEFESEVLRDGYFGRRNQLTDIVQRLRAELAWAGLIPSSDTEETR